MARVWSSRGTPWRDRAGMRKDPVKVHQLVKSLAGEVLSDSEVCTFLPSRTVSLNAWRFKVIRWVLENNKSRDESPSRFFDWWQASNNSERMRIGTNTYFFWCSSVLMLTPIPSSMWCDTQSALYHLRINAKLREVAKQWDFWCRGQESGTPWIMLADQDNMAVLLGLLLFWYCIDPRLRRISEGRFNLLAKESFISLIRSKVQRKRRWRIRERCGCKSFRSLEQQKS